MNPPDIGASMNREVARYLATTVKSRALWEQGSRYLPGGDTRTSVFWRPYPLYLTRGKGCRVWDADGVERIDFANNMTSLIHGHAHPAISSALRRQILHGTAFSAPHESQIHLARLISERIRSIELLRFTSSGTEATLNCLRAARTFTRRTKIAKTEGAYHGTYDPLEVSIRPSLDVAGDPTHPLPVASYPGLPRHVLDEVVVLPFNDIHSTERIIHEFGQELAAVIVDPVLSGSGIVPAERNYILALRRLADQYEFVLIFDEVISLRVAQGGAQHYYGIVPDLTAMGKLIGGGLPVGAFGGRREIMSLFDPRDGPIVPHAGTFQGNPLTMIAGTTTFQLLTPDVYDGLSALNDRLRQGIDCVCRDFGVPVQVTGLGSLFGIHFVPHPVKSYRDVVLGDKSLKELVFFGLLNEGIFVSSRLTGALSTPMTDRDVDAFVEGFKNTLYRLRHTPSSEFVNVDGEVK